MAEFYSLPLFQAQTALCYYSANEESDPSITATHTCG